MKHLSVSADAVRHNIRLVRQKAGNTPVYGVVKGNGYGLGAVELAKALRAEGITRFAVGELWEAKALRDAGFHSEEILLLRSTCCETEIEAILDLSLVAALGSYDAAVVLSGIAERRGAVAEAHIEIDTGMGRYGFLPTETDRVMSVIKYLPGVAVSGFFTHFYSAFKGQKATTRQAALFDKVLDDLRAAGFDTGTVHAANSSALFRREDLRYNAVRVGSAFAGRMPGHHKHGLRRVSHLECTVADVRWLPKGHTVGYSAGYVTRRPTRVAVLPAGWLDGLCVEKARDMYNLQKLFPYVASDVWRCIRRRRVTATVNGSPVPVLGHIGMQHTMADVTNLECKPGDTATLQVSPSFFNSGMKVVWE